MQNPLVHPAAAAETLLQSFNKLNLGEPSLSPQLHHASLWVCWTLLAISFSLSFPLSPTPTLSSVLRTGRDMEPFLHIWRCADPLGAGVNSPEPCRAEGSCDLQGCCLVAFTSVLLLVPNHCSAATELLHTNSAGTLGSYRGIIKMLIKMLLPWARAARCQQLLWSCAAWELELGTRHKMHQLRAWTHLCALWAGTDSQLENTECAALLRPAVSLKAAPYCSHQVCATKLTVSIPRSSPENGLMLQLEWDLLGFVWIFLGFFFTMLLF